ncbi:helix-turn-helix domain-containing protein [Roseovarius sp. EL26]|uniref:helix-turn-helix domain-containing protein n=1 Tax=Roseovarius sp. EL26 TaxID=2126672 RepID=UPI000EA3AC11|nr:helix-turn-helix transcriptional regulator [Roseovarius sp. EL26]
MGQKFAVGDFGRNLRKARKARGFSQEGFAHAMDLDRTYIGGIERGERNPGLKVIVRIADALELDVTELFKH